MGVNALFLDAAGVLLDTDRMPAQWQRLVGEFLAPRLGGKPSAWAAANVYAAGRMFDRMRRSSRGPRETHRRERVRWLVEMCAHVGVAAPPDAEALADDTVRWVSERVVAGYPEVSESLRALKDGGLTLFTSTGQPSLEIGGYLRAIGVRELVDRTYGPDLVDRWKDGPDFYRAICADAEVRPSEAATVDDDERQLDRARAAGLQAFLLARDGRTISRYPIARTLAEVPQLLRL